MRERWVLPAVAGVILGSIACSIALDFDSFREASAPGDAGATPENGADASSNEPGGGPGGGELGDAPAVAGARFDSYYFRRGELATFTVPSDAGVLVNDSLSLDAMSSSESLAARAGTFDTARGGQVLLAADGSFEYAPPSAAFWGDDTFEYQLASSDSPPRARVRLTVQPSELVVSELSNAGAGIELTGAAENDLIGSALRSLAAAGDINGDGLEDLVIGAPGPTTNLTGVPFSVGRAVYVVFGQRSPASFVLSEIALAEPSAEPVRGFMIAGDDDETSSDSFGRVVRSAGDVNGDGLDDLIVGTPGRAPSLAASTGAAYVIFGKKDGNPVSSEDIRAGRGGGFAIYANGVPDYNVVGFDAAGAGDVNGDGLDDVIVGVPIFDNAFADTAGGGFVVFGKAGPEPVLIETLTSDNPRGFAIFGDVLDGLLGVFVAGAGDINGDGLSDVALGTEQTPPSGASRVAVVYGRLGTSPVRVADLALNLGGFVLTSAEDADGAGRLSAAGDVNGDGLDDLLIGATAARLENLLNPPDTGASDAGIDVDAGVAADAGVPPPPSPPPTAPPPNPATQPGVVYVAFGSPEPRSFSLSELEVEGGAGFAIGGEPPLVNLGTEVSSGDLNGDGLSDIIATIPPSSTDRDRAFVIFGERAPIPALLSAVTTSPSDGALPQGFTVVCPEGLSGCGVAASGADLDGDGLDELIVGVGRSPTARTAGAVYVALGWDVTRALQGRERAILGTSGDDLLELTDAPVVVVRGGRGTDTLRYVGTAGLDLTERGRFERIEIIDVRGNGAQAVRLDEIALRRIPENHRGFAFSHARRLTVLGDADDTLIFDARGWRARPGAIEGHLVLGQDDKYYGLEISTDLQVFAPSVD